MTAVKATRATLRVPAGTILDRITWTVEKADRWVIVGANGSGKTSLLRLAAAQVRPTKGTVEVLGQRLGRTDMRELRRHIGVASAAIADQLRPSLTAHDAVVTGHHGALEAWWHEYAAADHDRADGLLEAMGCGGLGTRELWTLSQGERQRVLLARALMPDPGLVLLDEPAAGLDLAARESLVDRLEALTGDDQPPVILVTHHLEEIPPGMTHALLLSQGQVVAQGPIDEALTADSLSAAFGLPIKVERRSGRWMAWGR